LPRAISSAGDAGDLVRDRFTYQVYRQAFARGEKIFRTCEGRFPRSKYIAQSYPQYVAYGTKYCGMLAALSLI
jgi:hypothetical protein